MSPTPVAVTGVGCLCAAGPDLPRCVEALFRPRGTPRPPTRFATDHSVRFPVFEVADDLAEEGGRELLRTSRLALRAAREALADSGWDPAELRRLRVGVCLGTTVGSAMNNEEFYREFRAGGAPELAPIQRFLGSNPAASVARAWGLAGPCQTVVNACSSGTDAVALGAAWLRAGTCDVVLAGGADELCRVTYDGFASLQIAAPEGCRPFDRNRRGLNLGEGAAVLVLEGEELRRGRGGRARARVLGYGAASDAHHLTAPHPEGAGLRRALAQALATAGLGPAEVAFVNAHGTATPDNDRVEGRVLAEALPGVPFLSTKGWTGHALGAAGALEAAFTVACLEAGRVPASAGFAEPDPEVGAVPTAAEVAFAGRAALSQSLAFGGSNAVLALGRGEP